MNTTPRDALIILVALVLATCVGMWIADATMLLPAVLVGALVCLIVGYVSPVGFNPVVLGLLVMGYVLGNRGFAQFSISGGLPLFPAELGISMAFAVFLWRCAQGKKLPWQRDILNYALILWIALCTVRLPFDIKTYGAMALRDYAMVYYALFFFIAQEALESDKAWRWMRGCLLVSTAMLPFLYGASLLWQDFFLNTFTLRGIPIIYFKGDLAGTFMSLGALAWFCVFERHGEQPAGKRGVRWLSLLVSLGLVACMMMTENRAAMLALIAGVVVMLVGGRWRFAATLFASGAVAVVAILIWASVQGVSWEKTPLYGVSQRVVSVVDYSGSRDYSSATGAESKGDNNRFRAIWWETVVNETIAGNPWTGLGFGADLAESFLRAYYADSSDQFTTRSPHNLLLSIFARTGVVGLAAFLLLCVTMAVRTIRAVRTRMPGESFLNGEPWCYVWAIFVSACLGVVLEGPMGAVVFWIMLGAAAARGKTVPEQVELAAETGKLTEPGLGTVDK